MRGFRLGPVGGKGSLDFIEVMDCFALLLPGQIASFDILFKLDRVKDRWLYLVNILTSDMSMTKTTTSGQPSLARDEDEFACDNDGMNKAQTMNTITENVNITKLTALPPFAVHSYG